MRRRTGYLTGIVLTLAMPATDAAVTRVYRCESDSGEVSFSQRPCTEGEQSELQIEEVKSGWDAPVVPLPSLRQRKPPRRNAPVPRKTQSKIPEKCFKTRQRLEDVSRRLRRGYKPGRGDDLRHQRRQYEAYLSRFCD
jgi:hypothetical protein